MGELEDAILGRAPAVAPKPGEATYAEGVITRFEEGTGAVFFKIPDWDEGTYEFGPSPNIAGALPYSMPLAGEDRVGYRCLVVFPATISEIVQEPWVLGMWPMNGKPTRQVWQPIPASCFHFAHWHNPGGSMARDLAGNVRLNGVITSDDGSPYIGPSCQLPVGYRPDRTMAFSVWADDGGMIVGKVIISPDGTINPVVATSDIQLDGFMYLAAG